MNLKELLNKRVMVSTIGKSLFEIHPYVFVQIPNRIVVCWLEIEWPGREKDNVFVRLQNWDSAPVLELPKESEWIHEWFPGFSANSEVLVRLVQSRKQHSDEELCEWEFGPGKIRSWIPKGALEELP